MSRKNRIPLTICKNCETQILQQDQFCRNCGQENHDHHLTISAIIYEFVEGIIHYDNKIFTTLKVLFTKPGQLSKDYIEGKRIRYVPPVRLYIFTAFIYFFAMGFLLQKLGETLTHQIYKNNYVSTEKNTQFVFSVDQSQFLVANQINSKDSLVDYFAGLNQNNKIADFKTDSIKKLISPVLKNNCIDSVNIEIVKKGKSENSYDEGIVKYTIDTNLKSIYIKRANKTSGNIAQSLQEKEIDFRVNLFANPKYDSISYSEKTAKFKINQVLLKRMYENREIIDSLVETKDLSFFKAKELKYDLELSAIERYGNYNDAKNIVEEKTHKLIKYSSFAMYLMMPLSAFYLFVLFYRRQKFYFPNFLFSMHLHTMIFICALLYITPVSTLLYFYSKNDFVQFISVFSLFILMVGLLVYFYKSLRNFYQISRTKALLEGLLLSFLYFVTFLVLLGGIIMSVFYY